MPVQIWLSAQCPEWPQHSVICISAVNVTNAVTPYTKPNQPPRSSRLKTHLRVFEGSIEREEDVQRLQTRLVDRNIQQRCTIATQQTTATSRLSYQPLRNITSNNISQHVASHCRQGRTGSSNRPQVSRPSHPQWRNYKLGGTQISKQSPPLLLRPLGLLPHSTLYFTVLLFVTLSLAPCSHLTPYPFPVNGVSRLTYFNI